MGDNPCTHPYAHPGRRRESEQNSAQVGAHLGAQVGAYACLTGLYPCVIFETSLYGKYSERCGRKTGKGAL